MSTRTYIRNIAALRELQEQALADFKTSGNEAHRRRAMQYGVAKSKLRGLIVRHKDSRKLR